MKMTNTAVNLRLDLRYVILALLAIIMALIFLWRPWDTPANASETIKVTGETKLKAEPDEYVFSPRYSATNTNKEVALQSVTSKSTEVTSSLKNIGIEESSIKTNIDGYENKSFPERPGNEGFVYTLTVTVTVNSKDIAQKVQDFLAGSGAEGSVTPYANFSESKRKQLEDQARDEATKDARRKAEQSAENLGFKLGKVKSVEDGVGFGSVEPFPQPAEARSLDMAAQPSIQVMPGENELHYSVTVSYYVR